MKTNLTSKYTLIVLLCMLLSTTLSVAQSNVDSCKTKQTSVLKKRITAALLVLTMGPLGAHRIYLGCAPHVPVAYVATVGGGVGCIPIIDFFAIVFTKDFSKLEHNNQVFMWLRPNQNTEPE